MPQRPTPTENLPPRSRVFVALIALILASLPFAAHANIPGGGTGTGPNVTLVTTATSAVLSNGTVSILCGIAGATINQIKYTYNNGAGSTTTQMLNGGTDGGQLYWDTGGFSSGAFTYSTVVNPATGNSTHNAGDYGEIDLLSSTGTSGAMDVHYSMLRGSPGFYVTVIWSHRAVDAPISFGEARSNIYAGSMFNWLNVDSLRDKLMQVGGGNTLGVPGAPPEVYLWTSGLYQGRYEDKYKYSADLGVQRAWGWTSVGSGGLNIGLWDVNASAEYRNAGPMKRENMCHIGTTILNIFNDNHYGMGNDTGFNSGELWTKVYGPVFVYCNNIPNTVTDPTQASLSLFSDAKSQAVAEATAWPYSWFNNSNYTPASGRGTVTGHFAIADSQNPNASGSNLWVGVVQQPLTTGSMYDFQQWTKPYQFWIKADNNGNFTIPSVISGSNYTLYAFGPGQPGTFQSQQQSSGSAPYTVDIPAAPFSVTVIGGSTTALGTITWTPARVGPTVFEIGYSDRTAAKFRHGEDYWISDIGPTVNAPAPAWARFLDFPFDFPSGLNYTVGQSRWTTDWNFVQPTITDSAGNYDSSSSTITFNLASAPSANAQASLYIAQASNFQGPLIVQVNGNNIAGTTGYFASFSTPSPATDATVREGIHSAFSDNRITFPATYLQQGANTITLTMRKGGVITNHVMYDYLRLELTGYVPPPPASVTAYSGSNSALICWPVTPGATSYNILRSNTSGSGFTQVASNILGPVCGSGPSNAAWLDTTATNGIPYYYEIQSANPSAASANSIQSNAVTPSASAATSVPAAPTSLVTTSGNASATLSWPAVAGANYYTIQRTTLGDNGDGNFNTLRTITLNNNITALTYTDSSPSNSCIYQYSVMATNAAGTGPAISGSNVIPLSTSAPAGAPGGLTTSSAANQVTVNWAPVSGATGYILESATAPGGPYTYVASIPSLTYTVTGLANNSTSYFAVQAVNSAKVSSFSSAVSATTPTNPPTNIVATPGNTQATLTWTPDPASTSCMIERGLSSAGPFAVIASTSPGVSFTDSGLTNGTPYYYELASNNANGTGPLSSPVSVTPSSSLPLAPVLSAVLGSQKVILDWTAVAAATGYTVLSGTLSGGPYSTLTSLSGTTYTNSGLQNGATYYYVVYATNASGRGAYSNEVNNIPAVNAPTVLWTGSASSAWDTSTPNWLLSGTSATYADGYNVLFTDTASIASVVISGTVSPASISFNNSTLNYSVSGGTISGSTSLIKSGAGTLTFNNTNAFTGNIQVNGGTLALGVTAGTSATLGAGTIYMAQGTTFLLGASGVFVPNPLQVASGASATFSSSNVANGYSGVMTGAADSTLLISGGISCTTSGVAQFGGFSGLVDIPPGSQIRFSASGAGANGNGGGNTSFQVDGTLNTRNSAGTGGVLLGSLSGSGALAGQSNTPAGNDTYFIGSNNLSSTFSGAIANGANGTAAINKVGTGTLILSGNNTYTGPTTVTAGILEITGTLNGSSGITISGSGSLYLAGGTLTIADSVTNNGLFKISGLPAISTTGSFINNGVLDLINGAGTLPSGLVNHGTILTSGNITLSRATLSGSTFSITMPSYVQHTYQLQRAPTLSGTTWSNVSAAQPGTGAPITLQDPATTGSAAFYKVLVSP